MRINVPKTKIMLFNTSRKFDFPPEMILPNSSSAEYLDVVEFTRLLGIQISTDLRWTEQTNFIRKKANSKLRMLRRMKILNIDPYIIVDFYAVFVRWLARSFTQDSLRTNQET